MLAYVFWHAPASIDGISTYETALAAFHKSLDPADISGFRGSQACLVQGALWVSSPVVYEDWYLVDDFTALGVLNEAAVSVHRRRPHDDVASMAGEGVAGLYALRRGTAQPLDMWAVWFVSPPPCPMTSSSASLSAGHCGSGRWSSGRHQSSARSMKTAHPPAP